MAAITWRRRKRSQMRRRQQNRTQQRQQNRTQRRQRRLRGGKTAWRRAKHRHGKKHSARRPSKKIKTLQLDSVRMTNKAQNILHFCVHDLYKKVSLAAEHLRKKKRHVSITVSDVRNALKKIMPRKYDRKSVSAISCKCR